MSIEYLYEGMTMGQMVGIINQLIAVVNQSYGVVSGALVDGKIDYTNIVNRPRINGVEVVGSITPSQIGVTENSEVLQQVEQVNLRVNAVEDSNDGLAGRVGTLEGFRESDVERIGQLESEKTSRDNQVSDLVAEAALIVAASNQTTTSKNEAITAKNDAVAAKNTAQQHATTLSNATMQLQTLQQTVGDNKGGLVHDVAGLTEKVGSDNSGIEKGLKENRSKTNEVIDVLKQAGMGELVEKLVTEDY